MSLLGLSILPRLHLNHTLGIAVDESARIGTPDSDGPWPDSAYGV